MTEDPLVMRAWERGHANWPAFQKRKEDARASRRAVKQQPVSKGTPRGDAPAGTPDAAAVKPAEIKTEKEKRLEKAEEKLEKLHELEGGNWAVVTFRGVSKSGISYAEAAKLIKQLERLGASAGATIVTADTAKRLNNGRKNG